jgi:hypothetical protein
MTPKQRRELAVMWKRRIFLTLEERSQFFAPSKFRGKNTKLTIVWGIMCTVMDRPVLIILATLSLLFLLSDIASSYNFL